MLMPFGKFKGKEIHQIPRYYLQFCLDNWDRIDPDLRTAMEWGLTREAYSPRPKPTLDERLADICGYVDDHGNYIPGRLERD